MVRPAVQRISVFCASSPGLHPAYRAAAASFGRELANRGLGLVYGGGAGGLMGSVADGAPAAGGKVTGVIGIHRKPIGVLEVQGYFEQMGRLLDHGVGEGFLSAEDRALLILDEDPARLLDRLATQSLPPRPTWLLP